MQFLGVVVCRVLLTMRRRGASTDEGVGLSGARALGGVGAVAAGTLPFTGLSVFWVSLIAASMLLLGLVLMTAAKRPRGDS